MPAHTVVNLKEVQDMAPTSGMSPQLEARFAREALGLEQSGLSYLQLQPGFRLPFGHTHADQEEVYLVVEGAARVAVDDEVADLGPWDAIRIPAGAKHGIEAGDDGLTVLMFGAPNTENKDIEMDEGWWSD